uniref:Sushi domain-containing protein n=1 Tax=Hucho hucho TaxID=62062 RepID=A0A4W5M2D5_9TELE
MCHLNQNTVSSVTHLILCSNPQNKGRFIFNSKVTYACDDGYRLTGHPERVCQANRQWSNGDPPVCHILTCDPPPIILHGQYRGSVGSIFEVGHKVEYVCDEGYELTGDAVWTCLKYGKWDKSSHPRCSLVQCQEPPLDENHLSYELTTSTALVCLEEGGWNGTAPMCVPAECEEPPSPDHGSVNVTDTSLGSLVKYSCEEGYELEGESVRQCVAGRKWSDVPPVCRPISCGDPGDIDNGSAEGDSFLYLEVLRYECSSGFVLKGGDTRTCKADGNWDAEKPWCEPISCGSPVVPSDVIVTGKEYTFNKHVELRCKSGLLLQGPSVSVCQADGTWSHGSPECRSAHCGRPESIPNGRILGSDFGYSREVWYECEEGYILSGGEPKRMCRGDGLWGEGPAPHCDIIACDPPQDISHGYLNGSSFHYDDVVEYVCFDGYEVFGDPVLRCSAQGHWVGTVPECRPCLCTPPVLKYGVVLGGDHACGNRVFFLCDEGYKVLGPAAATCEKGGVWSPGVPVCGRGRCVAAPPAVPHAVLQGASTTVPDTVTYRCRPGYQMKGSYPHVTCGREGRWGEVRISCEPVSCGEPTAEPHAQVVGEMFTFGSQIQYRCDEGYELTSQSDSLTCQYDGTWSKHIIKCRPAPCPLPDLTPVGGAVTFSCPPGFLLQGPGLAECLVRLF